MKKRLIISNIIILIIVFLLSISYNAVAYTNISYDNSKKELANYLTIARSYHSYIKDDELVSLFEEFNNNIRITIIDLDGNVILDNNATNIESNHLYREEIINPGTYVRRKSTTVNENMLYLACKESDCYIRLAISINSINSYILSYIFSEGLSLLLILILSILILLLILKKSFEPLCNAASNLESITGKVISKNNDSLEEITYYINEAGNIINKQISDLADAKAKIEYIINNINQGIIIIEENESISLINSYALNLLSLSLEDVLNKNYLYAFRDTIINDSIKESLILCKAIECEYSNNGYYYTVCINRFDEKCSVIISDITKIKNMDTMKRQFFSNASHELKSPLTTIIGYNQLISEGIISDDNEIKEVTQKSLKEASRMNNIIIEMLELSKLEGQINYPLSNVNINSVIEEIIGSFNNRINEKNITLNLSIEEYTTNGSYYHIYTMVKNIIDNAIKYNKNNGVISIILNDKVLTISDTGIGIENQYISRIFERFFKVDKTNSKDIGSTGLGLAIVNHICKIYHYDIKVSSKLGVGTSFTIKFEE